jgi:hypothetical protein
MDFTMTPESPFDIRELMKGSTSFHVNSLDSIGQKFQTDKASVFTRTPGAKPHDYLRQMEPFFEPIRDREIKFLEIGVGGGESIRTWLEYFTRARIFGIDNVHSTNEWNTPHPTAHHRYQFVAGDQSDPVFWNSFVSEHGSNWGVILDDGGHFSNQVLTTLNSMWPHIVHGGLYLIEDLKCSYSSLFSPSRSPMDVLKQWVDNMHQGETDTDAITFSRELCVIRKK